MEESFCKDWFELLLGGRCWVIFKSLFPPLFVPAGDLRQQLFLSSSQPRLVSRNEIHCITPSSRLLAAMISSCVREGSFKSLVQAYCLYVPNREQWDNGIPSQRINVTQ